MSLKAGKLPGRKLKKGMHRYPCGQIEEELTAKQKANNMAVAVAARQRVFGLSEEDAKGQEGGTALGRLMLEGVIAKESQARDMVEAAEYFRERRRSYESAIHASRLTTATDYTGQRGRAHGGDGDQPDYVDWCNRSRAKYAEMRRAILECGDPLAMIALEMTVLEDRRPVGNEMMGALRCGLNAVFCVLRSERKAS